DQGYRDHQSGGSPGVEELLHGQPARYEGERGAVPGEEGPLIRLREARIRDFHGGHSTRSQGRPADRPRGGRQIVARAIASPQMESQGGETTMETASKVRGWTLAVVSIATAMLMLDIAVVNTAISDMGKDLNTGLDGLKWVVDAYTLALAAVVLTTGSLADRLGRRRVFAAGLAVFTVT